MFNELDLSFPIINYSGGQHIITYGRFPSLTYYNVSATIDLSMFKYKPAVRYCELRGTGFLRPHKDHGITCCVNYYIQSNGCTTHFYEAKPNAKPERYEGKTASKLYDVTDLTEVSSFVAADGDCYLLDVSQIHSVSIPKSGVRKFLSFNWFDHSYEEIKESLTCN
jgi:hypothetical protein